MQKCLYFLCPTDCLETIINNTFQQDNYFYTSLGNSFNTDVKTLNSLKCMIQKYHIRKICFVLSHDNKIIKDALHYQDFSDIKGLRSFYNEISKQQQCSVGISKEYEQEFAILSAYLNRKIKFLKHIFNDVYHYEITVKGKVYNKNKNTFTSIYSHLLRLEIYQLN